MSVTLNGTNGLTFNDGSAQNTAATGFGFKNRILNGSMAIDQRNAGASVTATTSNLYTVDRWQSFASANSKFTVQQNAGSVTPPAGFKNYLGVTSSSAYSISSSDFFIVGQPIEGLNIFDLAWGTANASAVTLSFRVYSSLTGTFGGALLNSGGSRSYPFTYTVSAANTWTTVSITIAGDTTGTWLTTNGIGLNVYFGLGVGSTYSGTSGSWAGANYFSATGATSVVGTNGATFYITGVQLEKGSTATAYDYRPYGTEFDLCRRYYARLNVDQNKVVGTGWVINSTNGEVMVPLRPQMRSVPTFGSSTASNFNINYVTCTALALSDSGQATVDTVCVKATTAGSLTASQGSMLRSGAASQYVEFISEL